MDNDTPIEAEPAELPSESPADEIRRVQARGFNAARTLTALGHPGYSAKYARTVIETVLRYEQVGLTVHEAIYGGLSADRKRFARHEAATS